jgi:signal peptide peptidase SppA
VQAVFDEPWAIMPTKLQAIAEVVTFRAAGGRYTAEQIADQIGTRENDSETRVYTAGASHSLDDFQALGPPTADTSTDPEAVAVLPVLGVLRHRVGAIEESSGMSGMQSLGRQIDALVQDPRIGAIVLDIDSPGGSVGGTEELASQILAARAEKPIVAVANTLAASAAYWIAAAASEIVVSPSALVGSIGCFTIHENISEAAKQAGVEVTLISAGKFKTEGNEFEELGDEARADIQARVDGFYEAFVNGVAQGRGVTTKAVLSGFGQGRVVGATDAVAAGMADRVATLDETVERMLTPRGRAAAMRTRAEASPAQPFATDTPAPQAEFVVEHDAEIDDADLDEITDRVLERIDQRQMAQAETEPIDEPTPIRVMDVDKLSAAVVAQMKGA